MIKYFLPVSMNLFTQGLINICICLKTSKIVEQLQSLKWLPDEIFVLDPEVPDDRLGKNTETNLDAGSPIRGQDISQLEISLQSSANIG